LPFICCFLGAFCSHFDSVFASITRGEFSCDSEAGINEADARSTASIDHHYLLFLPVQAVRMTREIDSSAEMLMRGRSSKEEALFRLASSLSLSLFLSLSLSLGRRFPPGDPLINTRIV